MEKTTKGRFRIGRFGTDKIKVVAEIKHKSAELIDLVDTLYDTESVPPDVAGEVRRLKALAQTDIQSASMWACKAVHLYREALTPEDLADLKKLNGEEE